MSTSAYSLLQKIILLLGMLNLAACSGFSEMQQTAAGFNEAARNVGAAQLDLFQKVQMAECNRSFYNQAFAYATAQKDENGRFKPVPLSLTGACTPQELTQEQLAIRQDSIRTITLYTAMIQTIATGKEHAELSDNSRTLAKNIQDLAKQQQVDLLDADRVAAVNTAVVTLAGMILDQKRFENIREAALAAEAPLNTIVTALKNENLANAQGLQSKAIVMSGAYRMAISSARDAKGPASFIDIIEARNTLQAMIIPAPDVAALNDMLDKLLAANHALATAENGDAKAIITDLVMRARQASDFYKVSRDS